MAVTDCYGRPLSLETCRANVGKGWQRLIDICYLVCEAHDIQVTQIKEKYGGLRFYIGGAPSWIHDVLEHVERLSFRVCERCGEGGTLRTSGWYMTRCDTCFMEAGDG